MLGLMLSLMLRHKPNFSFFGVSLMIQNKEDTKRYPITHEKGRDYLISIIRIKYTHLNDLSSGSRLRFSLFKTEAQGYRKAIAYTHNKARFKTQKTFTPIRERAQGINEAQAQVRAQRDMLIKALKYGSKYNTLTSQRLRECESSGISIRVSLIEPDAEVLARFAQLCGL